MLNPRNDLKWFFFLLVSFSFIWEILGGIGLTAKVTALYLLPSHGDPHLSRNTARITQGVSNSKVPWIVLVICSVCVRLGEGVSRVQLEPSTVQEFRECFRYFLSLCPHVQDRGSRLLFPHDPDNTPWPWPLTPILPNGRKGTFEAELVQKPGPTFKHSPTSFHLEQTVSVSPALSFHTYQRSVSVTTCMTSVFTIDLISCSASSVNCCTSCSPNT